MKYFNLLLLKRFCSEAITTSLHYTPLYIGCSSGVAKVEVKAW